MRHKSIFTCILLVTFACSTGESVAQADPFWLKSWNEAQKSKPLTISSRARIAAQGEPGAPMVIHGKVFQPDGRTPAKGVVVHAYHRDRDGFDFGPNDAALTTWRLQGWAETRADGSFEFQTIRPAPDHLGREAAHVHFTVESQNHGRQWAPTLFLADDPRVTDRQHRQSAEAGEFGGVRKMALIDGVQHVEVRIRLKEKGEF